MSRPKRNVLSSRNLTVMGVPKKMHDLCIEDFDTYDEEDLLTVRNFISEYLDNISDKFENNQGLFMYGSNGVGKAQPLYSKVLTKNGWVEMRDIKVGDRVYNRKGILSTVIKIFPQGLKKCYRVSFLDGRTVDCCDEHLWTYVTSRNNFKTIELREMISKGFKQNNKYRYKIPNNESIYFKKKELTIDPYILGVLLGDGSVNVTSINISISSVEEDIVKQLQNRLGDDYKVTKYNADNHSWGISYIKEHKKNPLSDKLKHLGLRCKSVDKFIPEDYLFSSIEQRSELLQGLFDTDGSVAGNGAFSYSTLSFQLYIDVMHLCRSLGIQCSGHIYDRAEKGIEYDIQIMTNKEIFTSEKHLNKWNKIKEKVRAKNTSKYDKTAIINAEYIGDEEMQCIMVDDSEQLYITDNFVVTHNTFLASMMVIEAYRCRYSARRVTFSEYISRYTSMWGAKTPEEKELLEDVFYNSYKAVEFLVLEEVGKELDTKLGAPVLEDLLRYREDNSLVTVICANLPPSEIKDRYGASVSSLLKGNMTPILIEGRDKRQEYYKDRTEEF